MSRLQPISISDRKTPESYNGLTESTFYDQIDLLRYPAIVVQLPGDSETPDKDIDLTDGILAITSSGTTTTIDLFSKTIIDAVIQLRAHGITAHITSPQLALAPAVFLENIQSLSYFDIKIDKSPIYIGDFNNRYISDLVEITASNPKYTIESVFDSAGKLMDFTYLDTTKNLYTSDIGTAIVQYRVNSFIIFANSQKLIATKALLNYARIATVTGYEKALLLDQVLNTFDLQYELGT